MISLVLTAISLSAQDKVEMAKQGVDHAEATVVSCLRQMRPGSETG